MRFFSAFAILLVSASVQAQPARPVPTLNDLIVGSFSVYKMGSIADKYDGGPAGIDID